MTRVRFESLPALPSVTSTPLEVTPKARLLFQSPFTHRSYATLTLMNPCEHARVAFKIKSTASKGKLAVKPCKGVVEPMQTVRATLTLMPVSRSNPNRCPPAYRLRVCSKKIDKDDINLDGIWKVSPKPQVEELEFIYELTTPQPALNAQFSAWGGATGTNEANNLAGNGEENNNNNWEVNANADTNNNVNQVVWDAAGDNNGGQADNQWTWGNENGSNQAVSGNENGTNQAALGNENGTNQEAWGNENGTNQVAWGNENDTNQAALSNGTGTGENQVTWGNENQTGWGDVGGTNQTAWGNDNGTQQTAWGNDNGTQQTAWGNDNGTQQVAWGDDNGTNQPNSGCGTGGDNDWNTQNADNNADWPTTNQMQPSQEMATWGNGSDKSSLPPTTMSVDVYRDLLYVFSLILCVGIIIGKCIM